MIEFDLVVFAESYGDQALRSHIPADLRIEWKGDAHVSRTVDPVPYLEAPFIDCFPARIRMRADNNGTVLAAFFVGEDIPENKGGDPSIGEHTDLEHPVEFLRKVEYFDELSAGRENREASVSRFPDTDAACGRCRVKRKGEITGAGTLASEDSNKLAIGADVLDMISFNIADIEISVFRNGGTAQILK
jgi:hypothetical protein